MSENDNRDDGPKCAICGNPLVEETWIDDDDFGDVHERCLEEAGGTR